MAPQADAQAVPLRPIRSFVRHGRLTEAQQRALDELWPHYGLATAGHALDPGAIFGRNAPLYLEVGFGGGENLAWLAKQYPQSDYLGVEVHRPGIGRLLQTLRQQELENVRIFDADVLELLRHTFAPHSLDGILVLFPDPWPKRRHRKRRLVDNRFLDLAHARLKPGGTLHLATDWSDYGRTMLEQLSKRLDFYNLAPNNGYWENCGQRAETRFEQRGLRLGHSVVDLRFQTR